MDLKREAALKAADQVTEGMLLGLGTGSTAARFIEILGERVGAGLRVTCVATSIASERQARALGITVLDRVDRRLDLTVDGADEIDPGLNLIKGLGGALLREKVVAAASIRMLVIATADKLVSHLGERSPLPVEILPLLWERTAETITDLGLTTVLRPMPGGEDPAQSPPYVTDNGNYIVDCNLKARLDPEQLAADLDAIPGVIGHGLFVRMASQAVIAGAGGVRLVDPA
ncbi:MAG TPA: ribose-5-phosphate isomerase RpiA [Candidatus Dormibacteraeota bacterium]|jgi:ribose 5-phosphate isomerase A